MITEYRISVTDTTISIAALAKWIRTVAPREANTLTKALTIARTMVFGEAWLSEEYELYRKISPKPRGVAVTKTIIKEKHELKREALLAKAKAKEERCKELLRRGAAGDAAAALKYCKLEYTGQVPRPSNYAFG